MRAGRDGAPYPGCLASLGSASLRAPTFGPGCPARAWRRRPALALPPTYAGIESEGDGAPYPGCVTPLAFGSLRAPTSVPFAPGAVGGDGRRLRFLRRTPGSSRRETARLTRAVWLRSAPPRCARRPQCHLLRALSAETVGACASSDVRRDRVGGRRRALPGLSGFARLRLAARADLSAICSGRCRRRRSALALPRTYAGIESEGDGAPYPGCLASLGSASLRAPAFGPGCPARAWRRRPALALPRTYAGIESEGDGAPYPGCLASLGSASLRAPAFGPGCPARAWRRRPALALPRTYAGIESEGDGAPYPGCLASLGSASLRAPTSVPFAPGAVGGDGRRLRFLRRTPGSSRRETARLTRAVWLRSAPPRCARRPQCHLLRALSAETVGACASSDVRRDRVGGRRRALPGLSGFARLRLAARADLSAICSGRCRRRRSALAGPSSTFVSNR